uniref:Odorant receptor n=1 Tax=Culicoides sonorensis TaxID=179676 RepID=A0A336N1Q6_CULSO
MTALERLESTKKRINLILKSVGFGVLTDDFKFNFITYFSIINCITYMCINGYDIKFFKDDLIRVCFCLVTWSFGYECTIRIIVFLSRGREIRNLYDQIRIFVQKNQGKCENERIVNEFVRDIDIQTKFIAILYGFCAILTLIYPGLHYMLTKEKILAFGFVIPGISYTTQIGYTLNYIYHICLTYMTTAGLTATTLIVVMLYIGACLMIEVITFNLKNLGNELLEGDDKHKTNREINLSEFVKSHQDILDFVSSLESLFSLTFMVDVISISFQIVITLMVCLSNFWIPGYIIILCVTFKLFLDCAYGLYIEIKFDDLCTAVYDFPWHLISIKHQKSILFILAKTQNPPLLTFGGVAYINMSTFVQVYKSIYSYFTVLRSFDV